MCYNINKFYCRWATLPKKWDVHRLSHEQTIRFQGEVLWSPSDSDIQRNETLLGGKLTVTREQLQQHTRVVETVLENTSPYRCYFPSQIASLTVEFLKIPLHTTTEVCKEVRSELVIRDLIAPLTHIGNSNNNNKDDDEKEGKEQKQKHTISFH
jgi:hypothetical protein